MPEYLGFDLYDERWRDCWVAATSAARVRKKQVDFDIGQRVSRLLEDYGPESDRPLTLRIYGTMIKGFCVINNERTRALFVDCERLVLAFARQPFSEGESKLRLPAAKRPKMEAALTLDVDLARLDPAEAFDWTQAPLEEGALLRLGGGGAVDEGLLPMSIDLAQAPFQPLWADLGPGLAAPGGEAGWLPSGLEAPPAPEAEAVAAPPPPPWQQPPAHDHTGPGLLLEPQEPQPPSQLALYEAPPADAGVAAGTGAEALDPAAAGEVRADAEVLLAMRVPRRHQKRELFAKPGVVYGFDDEPMMLPAEYDLWQQDASELSLPRLRAAGYAEALLAQAAPPERLAPHLRVLVDPAPPGTLPRGRHSGHHTAPEDDPMLGGAPARPPAPAAEVEANAPAHEVEPPPAFAGAANPFAMDEALAVAAAGPDLGAGAGGGGGAEAQDDRTAEVAEIIRGCLRASGLTSAAFHELVPPEAADRSTAACTFSALLALASAGELFVSQAQPYGHIVVSEVEVAW